MAASLVFSIRNRVADLARAERVTADFIATRGVSDEIAYRVQLAVEELLSNVIRYGYPDNGDHEISVRLSHDAGVVDLTIEDDGLPFDPSSRSDKIEPASLEHAETGGRGIALVKLMVGDLRYERTGGRNRVSVRIGA